MPLVSVILTSYNHEKFVGQAIESVLAQTFTDYELIIIDDCSTDGSWDVIKSFSDPRITAIRNEINNGWPIYNNLNRCNGKYIAIHHSHSYWEPDKLAKQVDFLESNNEYAAVFTRVYSIDDNWLPNDKPSGPAILFNQPNRTRYEWLRFFFESGNALCHPSVLIRKDVYHEAQLFNLALGSLPDFYMWVKVCLKYEIFIIQEHLTYYRILKHAGNSSGDRADNRIRYAIEIHWIIREFLKLDKPDEFLKVFPYAGKYLINDEIVIPFAFARMILDNITYRPYVLAAFQILYDIINDEKLAAKVQDLYSYNNRDFTKETSEYDIFSVVSEELYLSSKIRLNFGHGVDDHASWEKKIYIDRNGNFILDMDISSNTKKVSTISFVPDTGTSRGYCIEKSVLDGEEVTISPIHSVRIGEYDSFPSSWPEYTIEVNRAGLSKISIYGKVDNQASIALHKKIESLNLELLETKKMNHELNILLNKSNEVIQKLMGR